MPATAARGIRDTPIGLLPVFKMADNQCAQREVVAIYNMKRPRYSTEYIEEKTNMKKKNSKTRRRKHSRFSLYFASVFPPPPVSLFPIAVVVRASYRTRDVQNSATPLRHRRVRRLYDDEWLINFPFLFSSAALVPAVAAL